MRKSLFTVGVCLLEAMRAAPPQIAERAAVMDWPHKEGMPMRQLRAGTNGWMCMPSTPTLGPATQQDPMCIDKAFAALLEAWTMKSSPKVRYNGGPWVMWKSTPYAHLMIPTAAMPKMAAQ